MADETDKNHIVSKAIKWAEGLAAAFGALLLVDQGQVVGKTVPALWEDLKDFGSRALTEMQIAYEHAAAFFEKNWGRAKWVTLFWWVIAGALLLTGSVGATQGWSSGVMMTMRIVGIFLFAGYWWVAAALAKPFYYGMQAVKGIARGTANAVSGTVSHHAAKLGITVPALNLTAKDAARIDESAQAFQRFFYTLAAIVLLFGTFFVSSGTPALAVKLLKYGIPLAFVAALSGKFGWKTEQGWRLLKHAAILAFVVMVLADFGGDLVPESVIKWYKGLNQSEAIAIALLIVPSSLWLIAAFWKAKADAFKAAAKVMSVVCGIVFLVLWIRGSITTHQIANTSDETAAKMNQLQKTATNTVLDKAINAVTPSPKTGNGGLTPNVSPPPAGTGTYRSQERTVATVRPKTRVKVPAPEAPKNYQTLDQGLDDLKKLGY